MNRDELRLAIRRRADMVGSAFVSDDELDAWIDIAIAELHGILRSKYGDEFFAKTTWIQVNPGTDPTIAWPRFEANVESSIPGPDVGFAASYPLPDDFLSLLRVHFLRGTVTRSNVQVDVFGTIETQASENWTITSPDRVAVPMHPLGITNEPLDYTPRNWMQHGVAYRLKSGPIRQLSLASIGPPAQYSEVWKHGTIIDFLPVPNEQYAIQITYVQAPQLLPDHPHIAYVICGVAAMCFEKQQQDASSLLAEQAKVVSLISGPSATKDAANPPRVVDIYGGGRGRFMRSRRAGWEPY